MALLQIEWVIFWSFDAILMMEVIHSPGATSFTQQGRSGAVGNLRTFNSFDRIAYVFTRKIRINIFRPLAGQKTLLNKGLFDVFGLIFTHSIWRRPFFPFVRSSVLPLSFVQFNLIGRYVNDPPIPPYGNRVAGSLVLRNGLCYGLFQGFLSVDCQRNSGYFFKFPHGFSPFDSLPYTSESMIYNSPDSLKAINLGVSFELSKIVQESNRG